MKITVDTNLLVRVATGDDEDQAAMARALLALIDSSKVIADTASIHAGLRVHAAGGDFAAGIIAAAGAGQGGEAFVSFDRAAVRQVADIGLSARHASDLA